MKGSILKVGTFLAAIPAMAAPAFAELGTPAAAGASNLLGDATSGSETGIYELTALAEAGALIAVGVVIVTVAFMLGRKWLKRATG